MKFILEDKNENRITPEQVLSYVWSADANAACDGLRLTFLCGENMPQIYRVYVYDGEDCVFNGYADVQKVTMDASGCSCFLYARSSACLLVDNEAQPVSLVQPTSHQIFSCFAKEFGFENALPETAVDTLYLVQKGTSCFGVLHDFIQNACGSNVYVNAQNELCVYQTGSRLIVPQEQILSFSRITERGAPVSSYYYKIDSSEPYLHRLTSGYLNQAAIQRRRYVNLAAYPAGQRERLLKQKMYEKAQSYDCLEMTVQGEVTVPLFASLQSDGTQLQAYAGYLLYARELSGSSSGVQTKLNFKKKVDLQEVAHVAE